MYGWLYRHVPLVYWAMLGWRMRQAEGAVAKWVREKGAR